MSLSPRNEGIEELLSRELCRVRAPEFLWTRVRASLDPSAPLKQARLSFIHPVWTLAAILALVAGAGLEFRNRSESLNLGQYIETVQAAPLSSASLAIDRAPEGFPSAPQTLRNASLAGYRVAAERVAEIHGEPVRQVILTSGQGGETSVALFIASARLRLNAGRNTWIEDRLAGLKCQRLNCPRVRTIQFPCSKERCIVVCKACGEQVMREILTQLGNSETEFR